MLAAQAEHQVEEPGFDFSFLKYLSSMVGPLFICLLCLGFSFHIGEKTFGTFHSAFAQFLLLR